MLKSNHVLFAMILAVSLGPKGAQAQDKLQPAEVYKRCYIRMARMIPKANDPRLLRVQQGKHSAANACVSLFESAELGRADIMKNRTSAEAKSVLKTFHDLHQSWFSIKLSAVNNPVNYLHRDFDEPALYFTRAAFAPQVEFSSVVTSKNGLAGVRDPAIQLNDFAANRIMRYSQNLPYANPTTLILAYVQHSEVPRTPAAVTAGLPLQYVQSNVPRRLEQTTELGELVGVRSVSSLNLPNFSFGVSLNSSRTAPEVKAAIVKMGQTADVNAHLGGGVLGSQVFYLSNANLNIGVFAEDYKNINRRISDKVFTDLLCNDLPSLTEADVRSQVKVNSPYTFQRQSTCLQCHASMDEMAMVYRNNFIFSSASTRQLVGKAIQGVGQFPASPSATLFALRPPAGQLHFRELISSGNYRRSVVRSDFSNLESLGQKLAGANDLYRCASKRYYRFFTGIDVDLTRRADSKMDRYHQDLVLELADKLKSTQSVKSILRDIFSSESFQTRSYLPARLK